MRRYSLILIALMLALAIGIAACDSSAKLSTSQSPEQMLTAAWTAQKDAKSQSGTYEVALTVNADATQLPQEQQAMMQALLASPITVSGDFAVKQKPLGADMTVNANLMGTTLQAGGKVMGDQVWLNVLGQWYEAPEETEGQLAAVDTDNLVGDLRKALEEMDFDPATWSTDMTVVGEETLTETDVIHLRGTPNMEKMLTDTMALMQTEQMTALLGAAMPAGESTDGTALEIPTTAEIQEMLGAFDDILKDATVDLWLAKSDATIRKMAVSADVTIPENLGITGLSGLSVATTINLDRINGSVNIVAPTSALPFSDLTTNIEQNPIFQGIFRSISGAGL